MNDLNTSARYATALYEVATERECLKGILQDMAFIENLFNSADEIKQFCLKPHTGGSQEMLFVETAFLPYVSDLTGNMITAAVNNGRLSMLPLLPEAFQDVYDKRSGIARVLLETAHEPAEGLLDIVTERMRKRTGKAVRVEHKVNSELLGGLKVWCEGRLIDNSAAGRLVRLRRLLKSF